MSVSQETAADLMSVSQETAADLMYVSQETAADLMYVSQETAADLHTFGAGPDTRNDGRERNIRFQSKTRVSLTA
jgi:predicted DNA-binding protein (UPF0251 family)